jgi:uncharacterized protein (TIGR02246 family)
MTRRFDGPGDASNGGAGMNGFAHDSHVPAELIAAYADEELERGSVLDVERHLGECVVCQRSLRVQRAVRDRLHQEAAVGVPLALRDRVFAVVRAAPAPQGATGRKTRSGWAALLTGLARRPAWAVAAVLVIAVVGYSWNQARTSRAPVTTNPPGAVAHDRSDSAAILHLIQGHADAWNQRDAKAAAALLTEDAVWVTSAGVELRGRNAIEQAHAQWFAQDSAVGGTTHIHPPGTIAVRFVREDVAVADLEGQFVTSTPPGGEVTVLERARIFVVATRTGDTWHISQLRNIRRQGVRATPR